MHFRRVWGVQIGKVHFTRVFERKMSKNRGVLEAKTWDNGKNGVNTRKNLCFLLIFNKIFHIFLEKMAFFCPFLMPVNPGGPEPPKLLSSV